MPWNILAVEDSVADFLLIERSLREEDVLVSCRQAANMAEIAQAIEADGWEAVLCDYNMPEVGFEERFAYLHDRLPETPIILVSGSVGEEKAVELLKLGVSDFVLKTNLVRLTPVIDRCIKEAGDRRAKREAESALRISEAHYRCLFENMLSGFFYAKILYKNDTPVDFLFLSANAMVEGHMGLKSVIGKRASEAIPGIHERDPQLLDIFAQVAQTGVRERFEVYLRSLDAWFQVSAYSPEDGYFAAVFDRISDRKQEEARLRAEEERYRRQRNALLEFGGRPFTTLEARFREITEMDAKTLEIGRVSVWRFNEARTAIECLDMYDLGADSHTSGAVLDSAEYPRYFEAIAGSEAIVVRDARVDPRTREFTDNYLNPLGITSMLDIPLRLRGVPYGVLCHEHVEKARTWTEDEIAFAAANSSLVSLALEEAERKKSEEVLSLRNAALEAAANAIVITDAAGTIEWANAAFSALSGYPVDEAIGRNPRDLLKSDKHDFQFYKELWETILAGKVWHGELINRRKDGRAYHEEMRISPLRDVSGAITHFIAIKQDITERKHRIEHLRETQERLQRAVEAGNVGLWEWDFESNKVYYSPEWKRQIGYENDEIGEEFDELQSRVHPDDLEHAVRKLQAFYANPGPVFTIEFRLRHKDGTYRWILAQSTLLFDEGGNPSKMVGTHVDITDRKQLEEQFLHAQKMESVGRLAGGVAHDFNNLLCIINGYADFAVQSLSENDPLRNDMVQILRAGDRAAAPTRQLLAFSRRQVLQPETVNLNQLVEESEKMLRRLIGEDIELAFIPEAELGNVRADPGQIEQAIMNLVINARDAMPTGGNVTIETKNLELSEMYASQHFSVVPGRYVQLTISDTGCGMDAATMEKIFDPFFTTKETGKGTGLGLATVYGIVKQSGGHIFVYSEVGRGSTFKILLPRDEQFAPVRAPERALVVTRGVETILLVEDDETLRGLAQRILQSVGYKVMVASNGGEALLLLERFEGPVHLIVTDVVMPGMSGRELVDRLGAIKPEMKVLYMSGYTDDAIVRHGILDESKSFVAKPFTPAQLTRKVREVLGHPLENRETGPKP